MSVFIGAGSSFSYSTDNGGTYTPLAKITGFTPAKIKVAKVTTDAFDNATFNGLPQETSIPGWVDPGTYAVKLFTDKTVMSTLRGLVGVIGTGSTTTKFKVIKSDGSGGVFAGYISELGEEIPLKEGMETMLTIEINAGVSSFSTAQS
jgi:hypothetical protein